MPLEHPILHCPAKINGRHLQITPEQYETLVEELCSLAFCFPHLSVRLEYLAQQLNLPEVKTYVGWCREANGGVDFQ